MNSQTYHVSHLCDLCWNWSIGTVYSKKKKKTCKSYGRTQMLQTSASKKIANNNSSSRLSVRSSASIIGFCTSTYIYMVSFHFHPPPTTTTRDLSNAAFLPAPRCVVYNLFLRPLNLSRPLISRAFIWLISHTDIPLISAAKLT